MNYLKYENFELSSQSKNIIKKTLNINSLDEVIDMDYSSSRSSLQLLNLRKRIVRQIHLFLVHTHYFSKNVFTKILKYFKVNLYRTNK